MKTGLVIGNIWATRKDEKLEGLKLMVVQPFNIASNEPVGEPIVAADIIGAGVTEKVIFVSGSTARVPVGQTGAPVDATIVGIIDGQDVLDIKI